MTGLAYHLPPREVVGVSWEGGGVLWIKEGRMRARDNEADLS